MDITALATFEPHVQVMEIGMWAMTDARLKIIDQTIGVVIVAIATVLFVTPVVLLLSPVLLR